jgi:arylsulfatase A-like enzyme
MVAQESQQPNILIFFVDDMGWGDSQVYNSQSLARMPTVDSLASAGMTFLDAHTPAAVCAPTRYSILSGNYPWRSRSNEGVWSFNGGSAFLDGQKTIATILQEAGYNTAMIGKSHLGALIPPKNPGTDYDTRRYNYDWTAMDFTQRMVDDPTDKGFTYTYLAYNGIQGEPFAYFENGWIDLRGAAQPDLHDWPVGYYDFENPDSLSPQIRDTFYAYNGVEISGRTQVIASQGSFGLSYWRTTESGSDLLDKALAFLDDHHSNNQSAESPQPFFMHYCTPAVHQPHVPPVELHGVPIRGEGDLSPNPGASSTHLDMLYEVDTALGKLMQRLEDQGVLDDTLVIFASDNGGLGPNSVDSDALGHDAVAGLRGSKTYIYEGGHRVPLIVRWGDGTSSGSLVEPGSVSNQLVSVTDLFATLADLVGVPTDASLGRDSVSMKDIWLENSTEPIHDFMLFQDYYQNGPLRAIREGDFKLITGWSGGPLELYDLGNDLAESNNLVNDPQHAGLVQRLEDKLDELIISYRSKPVPMPFSTPQTVPANLGTSHYQTGSDIVLIEEKTVQLDAGLEVDILNPSGLYLDADSSPVAASIPAQTVVRSHLLHYAPTGNGLSGGTWTFDSPIIGLVYDNRPGTLRLTGTDALFALDGVTYPDAAELRSSIVEQNDTLWVSPDGRTLSVNLIAAESLIQDIPVPSPGFESLDSGFSDTTDWELVADSSYGDGPYPTIVWNGPEARTGSRCVRLGLDAQEKFSRIICNLDPSHILDKSASYYLEAYIRRIPGNDNGIVGLRMQAKSGGTWRTLKQLAFRATSDGWAQVQLDIAPKDYPGNVTDGSPMRILIYRDNNFALPGVLVDDISLRMAPAPANGGLDQIRVLTNPLADRDADGLGDEWERRYFGNLETTANEIMADGRTTALLAYAFASNPHAGPPALPGMHWSLKEDHPTVSFLQTNDSRLDFAYYFSTDLDGWSLATEGTDYLLSSSTHDDPTMTSVEIEVLKENPGSIFMQLSVSGP